MDDIFDRLYPLNIQHKAKHKDFFVDTLKFLIE